MAEAPTQVGIQNVLAMDDPQQMLAKLLWEIDHLTHEMSVWKDNEPFPAAVFMAFNAVVTAWHITDWLWQSGPDRRAALAKKYGFNYVETETSIKRGLEKFQDAVRKDSLALRVCYEIATGSKHMRKNKINPDVKARAEWHKALESVGVVKAGDLVMNLTIEDEKSGPLDPIQWFIDAFGYWDKLFRENDWIKSEKRLPDKIIRAPHG
jgi:hypothetical protein